jgi:two-component system cell cycle sensor histidine kinase/response regulator CckA
VNILVVEDEGLIAHNLANSLRKSGYVVSGIAPSGEDALEKVRALKPDLVLMDIQLSGKLDGIETAEQVRSRFSIPVVFLTAHATPDVLDRAKRTQPFGFLVKPFRPTDLVSAIEVARYQHQMELALRQRESWLAATLSCVGDCVVVTDARGRIEFLNDLAKNLLRLQDRNVIGKDLSEVVHLKSRFTDAAAGNLVQLAILQGATISIGPDVILVDALDDESDIEGDLTLCKVGGLVVGTVFTFRSVTLRNHQEEQQRQDLGNLACGRLASAVSSELKHLLQSCLEGSEGLPQITGPGDPRPSAVLTSNHVGWISRMIDQLDVIKQRSASFPCTLDLNALVLDICSTLRPDLPSNISLTSHLQPELDRLYADPAEIKEAILNLVLHSQDCIPSGGAIQIITRNYAFEYRTRAGQVDNYVRLTVEVTSPAMKPGSANPMFEPFSQADPSEGNWDLRLFLAHGAIGAAGGSIRAQALQPDGISFEILLPRSHDRNTAVATRGESSDPQGVAPAILLLHADHDVRSLVAEGLEREGYETLGAPDFEGASEWLAVYPGSIGLLITDLDLFHMSGPALAGQMLAQHPALRVVFTGDHAVEGSVKKTWMGHGGRFLERPFRLEELLGVVNEMMTDGYTSGPAKANGMRNSLGFPVPEKREFSYVSVSKTHEDAT